MERLGDFKIDALSVLQYLGSLSAPDEATLKKEAHDLQCTTAGPHNAIPTTLLRAGSACGLGLDVFGIHLLSLAARYRTAVNSGTLVNGLAKIRAAREHDSAPIFALSLEWDTIFLKTPTAHSTMEGYEYVRHLDHAGKIAVFTLIRNKRLPRLCSATRSKKKVFLYRSLRVPPKSWNRSADT